LASLSEHLKEQPMATMMGRMLGLLLAQMLAVGMAKHQLFQMWDQKKAPMFAPLKVEL
jgi:hypothetical protein